MSSFFSRWFRMQPDAVAQPAIPGVPGALAFSGAAVPLGAEDIELAARDLGCEAEVVRAVIAVETGGAGGFLTDGSRRPRILFEAHLFSRATGGRYDASHPRISSPRWDRQLYIGGAGEYDRLAEAVRLDRKAAIESASWGLFQILASNHLVAGYATAEEFVREMCADEDNHLEAFVRFCKANGLDRRLAAHDWAGFAARYNGPSYWRNRYDTKLATAYAAERRGVAPGVLRSGVRGPEVRRLQEALNRNGASLVADGIFGRATELALEAFQERHGLPVTGANDNATVAALGIAS